MSCSLYTEVLLFDAAALHVDKLLSKAHHCECCVLEFSIKRDTKWGGDKNYTKFEEVEKDFAEEVCCRSFLFLEPFHVFPLVLTVGDVCFR